MKTMEIYTKSYCPYCRRAKELLRIKGVEFIEYDVTTDPAREQEMRPRSGRTTVPEIFVGDQLSAAAATSSSSTKRASSTGCSTSTDPPRIIPSSSSASSTLPKGGMRYQPADPARARRRPAPWQWPSPPPPPPRRSCPACAPHLVRQGDPRHLVVQKLGIALADQGQDPHQNRHVQAAVRSSSRSEHRRRVDRLGLDEAGSRGDLLLQPPQLPVHARQIGIEGGAEEKLGCCPPVPPPSRFRPALRAESSSSRPMELRSKTLVAPASPPTATGSPVTARMVRIPSRCAPISSECRPIRLRSRQVTWTITSTPVSSWICRARARLPMRMWARGFSARLMASTPAAASCRAPASTLLQSKPRGGSSSTVTTGPPARRSSKRPPATAGIGTGAAPGRGGRGRAGAAGAVAPAADPPGPWPGGDMLGVVPQQPPTRVAPAATMSQPACGEILGGGQVDVAAVEVLGKTGIGKGRQGQRRDRRQPLQHLEQFPGTGAAVGAESRGAGRAEARGRLLGAHPLAGAPPFEKGHLRHRGQPQFGSHGQGQLQIVEAGEGLEQEQVDPAFGQGRHLLAKHLPLLARRQRPGLPPGADQRSDGARHQPLGPGHLARQPGPGAVDVPVRCARPTAAQAQGIGAEGVGLQQRAPRPRRIRRGPGAPSPGAPG